MEKPKDPFYLLPHYAKFLYLCPSKELHQVKLVAWGRWIPWKKDEVIVPMDTMLSMLFNMVPQSMGPRDEEGKAVIQ